MTEIDDVAGRRMRIVAGLRGRNIEQAAYDPALWKDMQDEAASDPDKRIITPELIGLIQGAQDARATEPNLQLFVNSDDVIIIPGFLGSELVDGTGGNGLIWIDPTLVFNPGQLDALKLDPLDRDAVTGVQIQPHGAIPIVYSGLKLYLQLGPYTVDIFGFDWRKNLESAAKELADVIRSRQGQRIRPLHLVAHSQGSLVARRALQMLGSDLARQLVNTLVLLGPASAGTFASAIALAGSASLLETMRRFGIKVPDDFNSVVQTMTGIYQLLPWRAAPVDGNPAHMDSALKWIAANEEIFKAAPFWQTGIDASRLASQFGWGSRVDTSFFNDRTTIILGDKPTIGGVQFQGAKLVEDPTYATSGDGTVPDSLAVLPGVSRVYKARDAEHMMLPATWSVISAVRSLLAGKAPSLTAATAVPVLAQTNSGQTGKSSLVEFPYLVEPGSPTVNSVGAAGTGAGVGQVKREPIAAAPIHVPAGRLDCLGEIPAPQNRRLRVFSFDPLLGNDLDALDIDQITLELPWDFADGNQLSLGPVGEYVEVVDFDPSNNCFYPPIDLNHPHLLAQDGLAPTEGDPRFHQQMVYAVSMNSIHLFEMALGRPALWAPHLSRDPTGAIISSTHPEDEFVRRLRIYPHAMRQANAFYHPDRKALLFGYFQAQQDGVERNLPGGTVFTCLSYDIVAHETTHALLDGVHRYFTVPSNQDVFAFHEGFADVVAMFQHFSHPEVLRHVIAKTRGDITRESEAAVLAAQFGDAMGNRGALREYLGRKVRDENGELVRDDQGRPKWEPVPADPSAVKTEHEPHKRGAIFVAALFRAFTNIYECRVADLRRIATNGSGILPDGDLPLDLVLRMADEAAKAARHMLNMCIRAIDYIPPVDVTFGEYLRGLITADYDLVKNDDRRYRAAVISAFRDWGIYPADVRSLAVDSLIWKGPETDALRRLGDYFAKRQCACCGLDKDRLRAFVNMKQDCVRFHDWLIEWLDAHPETSEQELGVALRNLNAPRSIRRDANKRPIFEVHAFRPCHRIGPDGQERTDFVVEIVQRRKAFFDENQQAMLEFGTMTYDNAHQDFYFRGGCTLVIDSCTNEIRYCVRKSIYNDERLNLERQFRQSGSSSVGAMYLSSSHDDPNPFGLIHCGH